MYFSSNLQFLRKQNGMTQEKLAQKLNVSRQAISKWESGETVPEVATLLQLAELFSCKLDDLLRQELSLAQSPVRIVTVKGFRMVRYCVISPNAQQDAETLLKNWAAKEGIPKPSLLLWSFPYVTQEQKNRFSMTGFEAACILPEDHSPTDNTMPIMMQPDCSYACITIPEPTGREGIAQGIRTILEALRTMGIPKTAREGFLPCFERRFEKDSVSYVELFLQCQDAPTTEVITLN